MNEINNMKIYSDVNCSEFNTELHSEIKLDNSSRDSEFFNSNNAYLATTSTGETLLHIAAKCGNVELAEKVIRAGVAIDSRDCMERTPLMLAALHNKQETVDLLLKHKADIFCQDVLNSSTLGKVFGNESGINFDIGNTIINNVNVTSLEESVYINNEFHKECPIYHFSSFSNPAIMEYLLIKGSPVDAKDESYENKTALHDAVEYKNFGNVHLLVTYGADVNAQTMFKDTPISFIPKYEKKDEIQVLNIVKILLSKQAMMVNNRPNSKIFVRRLLMYGSLKVVKMLIDNNINLHYVSNSGEMPIHILAKNERENILSTLDNRQVQINVHTRNRAAKTMLHLAVENRNVSSVRKLLENGAAINTEDGDHFSPLRTAIEGLSENYLMTECEYIKTHDCIEELLNYGADPAIYHLNNFGRPIEWFDALSRHFYEAVTLVIAQIVLDNQLGREYDFTQNLIQSSQRLRKIYDANIEELNSLQVMYSQDIRSITLYNFLTADDRVISLNYANNQQLVHWLSNTLLIDDNSYYYRRLRARLTTVINLIELRKRAAIQLDRIFQEIFKISVINVASDIIKYLQLPEFEGLLS